MTWLYIPTYGRVGRQETWNALPDKIREHTALIARPEEADALRASTGALVLECPLRGISPTRQWIYEQHEGDRLLMVDDDLKFAARRVDEPTKFQKLVPGEPLIGTIFQIMYEEMDEMPVVGLASRGGANRETSEWRVNQRIWDVMGFRVDIARKEGFRYRKPLMEDFDLHLQFLTRGYPSAMLNSFTKDDFGSNAAGGCSTYRDATMQAAAAIDLVLDWPDFVSLRQTKNDWGNGMEQRWDVRVAWAKAYKAGIEWRKANGKDPWVIPLRITEPGLL